MGLSIDGLCFPCAQISLVNYTPSNGLVSGAMIDKLVKAVNRAGVSSVILMQRVSFIAESIFSMD
jgi:hypothetical protein